MFGGDMMAKLQEMQAKAEESKNRLDNIIITGEAGGNLVRIELNGNRKLKKLTINANLQEINKEDLEDFLFVALNKALEAAEKVNEQEMTATARGFLPGL